jgi:hypothetical protein
MQLFRHKIHNDQTVPVWLALQHIFNQVIILVLKLLI